MRHLSVYNVHNIRHCDETVPKDDSVSGLDQQGRASAPPRKIPELLGESSLCFLLQNPPGL